MASLLEENVVWGIIEGYDMRPASPVTDSTVTEIKGRKEWMNRRGIARPTIPLGTKPRLQNEYIHGCQGREGALGKTSHCVQLRPENLDTAVISPRQRDVYAD